MTTKTPRETITDALWGDAVPSVTRADAEAAKILAALTAAGYVIVPREPGGVALVAPLMALVDRNIPGDILELLVHGSSSRGIAPCALMAACRAMLDAAQETPGEKVSG